VASIKPGTLRTNETYKPADKLAGISFVGVEIDTKPWGYRKSLSFTVPGTGQLELDPDVLAHAAGDFRDLRIVQNGRQMPYLIEKTSIARAVPLTLNAIEPPKQKSLSRWSLKLPRAGLPLTRVICTPGPGVFERRLRLYEMRTDERGDNYETEIGQLAWTQTPDKNPSDITIDLSRQPATDTIVLETDNGDNPPMELRDFRGFYPVTRVITRLGGTEHSDSYLYYGNEEANSPRYDVRLVADSLLRADKMAIASGPEQALQRSAGAESTNPTGAMRYLFWGVLALVVIGLLVLTSRMLPRTS